MNEIAASAKIEMKEHLTSKQVTGWQSGVTGAEEILQLDDHLAECPDCRALVAGQVPEHAGATVRLLRAEFSSPHLTESQLDDYAAHKPQPADLMQHLDVCHECRADADDLRQFADANRTPAEITTAGARADKAPIPIRRAEQVWLRPMAAAVAITALGLSAWFALHKSGGQPTPSSGIQAPTEIALNIPPQYRGEVKAAIDSGNLHVPSSIAGITVGPIQLRSLQDPTVKPALYPISPVATAVVEDTPLFQWTAVEGATYSVSVYDDQFRAVASARSLTGTEWRPAKPLARGAVYRWEVRAVKGTHVDRAPGPTEPEARFMILGADDVRRLDEAHAAMPNDPLALGILYADAGALMDARREFALAEANGDSHQKSAAERLLNQLTPGQLK